MMDIFDSEVLLKQLKERKIDILDVKEQILRFKKGYRPAKLLRPCTLGDGVKKLSDEELNTFIEIYDNEINKIDVCKFVPASGAATRMFRDLLNLQDLLSDSNNELNEENKKTKDEFISNIDNFAFRDDLEKELGSNLSLSIQNNLYCVLNALLNEEGLNYKNLPKGLIKFHKYKEEARTPFEEHFIEAVEYLNSGNKVKMHFTIQKDFQSDFENEQKKIKEKLKSKDIEFDISFSVQDPATDTIAVDLENTPVLTDLGKLHFRPAGHGALIRNLNNLDSEYVFIKNIDNVTVESLLGDTVRYKKALAGVLLSMQEKIFDYLSKISESNIDEIVGFCEMDITIKVPHDIKTSNFESKKEFITEILNRPIRVVGVVKNEGEPGGGPFWVEGLDGNKTIQIVESAQVDMDSKEQKNIWEGSTHFNPVDIVCGLYNFEGNKFDLLNFVDYEAGIITKKSLDGKDIKALELPGLWNGAMADWITVFVEVPLSTFNPVKTVFDILRKEHQAA